MQALDVDYLAFSFHKMLAPFGVGVLVRQGAPAAQASLPFLYGGDMIAEGQVSPGPGRRTTTLPWKYAAGTPNILGVIVSAQALRLLLDLASAPARRRGYFGTDAADRRAAPSQATMGRGRRGTPAR